MTEYFNAVDAEPSILSTMATCLPSATALDISGRRCAREFAARLQLDWSRMKHLWEAFRDAGALFAQETVDFVALSSSGFQDVVFPFIHDPSAQDGSLLLNVFRLFAFRPEGFDQSAREKTLHDVSPRLRRREPARPLLPSVPKALAARSVAQRVAEEAGVSGAVDCRALMGSLASLMEAHQQAITNAQLEDRVKFYYSMCALSRRSSPTKAERRRGLTRGWRLATLQVRRGRQRLSFPRRVLSAHVRKAR